MRIPKAATFRDTVHSVRAWKATKKVAMTYASVRRCARELGCSSALVRDAMNAAGIHYRIP